MYFISLDRTALKFPKLNISATLVKFCFSYITVLDYEKTVYQTLFNIVITLHFIMVVFMFLDNRISIYKINLQCVIFCPMMVQATIYGLKKPVITKSLSYTNYVIQYMKRYNLIILVACISVHVDSYV